jgi:hypothetical protein
MERELLSAYWSRRAITDVGLNSDIGSPLQERRAEFVHRAPS